MNLSSRSLPFREPGCRYVCRGHIIVAVNPLPLSANPAPRNVSLSAAILAGRQVTSRAEEDPGIADSDGDVVVGNDGREEEGGWIRRCARGDFDLV